MSPAFCSSVHLFNCIALLIVPMRVQLHRPFFDPTGPSCEIYMKIFNQLQKSVMSNHGCKIYAFSSQNQRSANQNKEDWQLTNIEEVVGDQGNAMAKFMRSDPELFPELEITGTPLAFHPYMHKTRYPNGATQPAVIFFVRKQAVVRWCNYPSIRTLGGAWRRPDPEEIWKEVQKRIPLVEEGKTFSVEDGKLLSKIVRGPQMMKVAWCPCLR